MKKYTINVKLKKIYNKCKTKKKYDSAAEKGKTERSTIYIIHENVIILLIINYYIKNINIKWITKKE